MKNLLEKLIILSKKIHNTFARIYLGNTLWAGKHSNNYKKERTYILRGKLCELSTYYEQSTLMVDNHWHFHMIDPDWHMIELELVYPIALPRHMSQELHQCFHLQTVNS